MKWFKHYARSWDDEKLASLVGEGGSSGLALYGGYWRVAEVVAAQMEGPVPACSVSYSLWRWAQKLSVRKSYARSILLRLQKEGLLVLELAMNADQIATVTMPNLLKYRDEYSRKSGGNPENVPSRTEGEGDKEILSTEAVIPPEESRRVTTDSVIKRGAVLEEIYHAYPRHVGKEAALKSIRKALGADSPKRRRMAHGSSQGLCRIAPRAGRAIYSSSGDMVQRGSLRRRRSEAQGKARMGSR